MTLGRRIALKQLFQIANRGRAFNGLVHVVGERAHDLQQIELASQNRVQLDSRQQERETIVATYGNLAPYLPK